MRSARPKFLMHRCVRLCMSLFLLVGAFQTLAQDEDIDFSEMSLEDLLNVEVVTASKKAESVWDAPGIVTSFSSREIQSFGANNLHDVIDRMVGVNYSFDLMDYASIRGSAGWGFQYHMLMLIDGRPVRTPGGNGASYSPLSAFPLIAVERIELVRGPGSVLYGSNGFFGVINIVTKKATEDGTVFSGGVKAGSFGTSTVELAVRHKKGDLNFNLAGFSLETDGWPSVTADSVDGHTFEREAFDEAMGFDLSLSYKGFKLGFYHGKNDRWANYWDTIEDGFFDETAPYQRNTTVWQLRAEYQHDLSENWSLTGAFTKTDERFAWADKNGPAFGLDWPDSEEVIEATLFGSIGEKINLLAGVTHETRAQEHSETVPAFEEQYMSLYAQVTYDVTEKVKLIGGGQLVKALDVVLDGEKESVFVPRIGAILNFNDDIGMKLLYSEAFRSPPADLKLIDDEFEIGNPDLESETISTTDIQLFIHKGKVQGSITLFNNQEENLIGAKPNDEPEPRNLYQNFGNRETQGIEIETKFVPNENWYFLASLTTQENEDQDGVEDTTLQPHFGIKIGINYSAKKWGLGVFNYYSDAPPSNEALFGDDVIFTNPEPDSFNYLTANFNYRLKGGISFDAFITNVLDEEIYTPPDFPVGTIDNSYQGRGERAFYGSIKYRY